MHAPCGPATLPLTIPSGSPAHLKDICKDTVGSLTQVWRNHGPLVAYPKGTDLNVFAFSPEANRAIFSDTQLYHTVGIPGPKNSAHRHFRMGLFALNGNQHRDHRRLLMPAMAREAVLAQGDIMARTVESCLDGWRPGQQIDLYGSMKELALAIAGKLLFGLDEIPCAGEVARLFQDWLDGYFSAVFEMVLPTKGSSDAYPMMLARAEELEVHFRRMIELRQATLKDGDNDLLALLLRARKAGRINDIEVIGEIHTLLNASYQTTASALTWTVLLLCQHPEVLRELHDQLLERPGLERKDGSLFDRVVREALRLLPPVVFNFRLTTRRTNLCGQDLPEGSFVFMSYYVTHHMPDLYPEPERFRPERWLERSYSPYEYLPFSAGPRMCVGTIFSLQFFQIAIPAIIRRFRLALAPGTRVDRHSSLTLGVRGSLPVMVLKQDGRFSGVPLTGDIHDMVDLPQSPPARVAA